MATNILGGSAFIKINGQSYFSVGDWSVTMGGEKREPIMQAGGKIFYNITDMPGKVTGSISTDTGLSLADIRDASGVVVQVQQRNGRTYVLRDASFTGDAEATIKDGTFAVEFTGQPVREV